MPRRNEIAFLDEKGNLGNNRIDAEEMLKTVQDFGDTLISNRKEVDQFKANLEKSKYDLSQKLLETKDLSSDDQGDNLTSQFDGMVDEVQKAYIEAFQTGGDLSFAREKERQVSDSIDDLLGISSFLMAEMESIPVNEEAFDNTVLHSQYEGDGSNGIPPEKRRIWQQLLQDPSKQGFRRSDDGNSWIITYDGKDVLNGSAALKQYESGQFDMLERADDYSDQVKALDVESAANLDKLKTTDIEENYTSGNTITTTQKENYADQINAYYKRANESLLLDAMINESTYQTYVPRDERYDNNNNYINFNSKDPEIIKKTRDAILKKMVTNRFPNLEGVLDYSFYIDSEGNLVIGDDDGSVTKKTVRRIDKNRGRTPKTPEDYRAVASDLEKDSSNIISKTSKEEKLKALVSSLNSRSSDKFQIMEGDDGKAIYKITSEGDFPVLDLDASAVLTKNQIIMLLNRASKSYGIPATDISRYLGKDVESNLRNAPDPIREALMMLAEGAIMGDGNNSSNNKNSTSKSGGNIR